MNSKPNPESTEPPKFQLWWLVALLAIWLGIGFVPKLDCSPGTFGDMFGMVNSLFSGLAFLGLIHAIRLQNHEISLQRQDLELTRIELNRSATAQADSAQALALQVIISSITSQISTALQRRTTAIQNERELVKLQQQNAGTISVQTPDGTRSIIDQIEDSRAAMKFLTEEIDRLSKRLRDYDALLTGKLDNLDQHNTSSPQREG